MIKFTKMHGLGNDYVYIDAINQKIENESSLAKFVSNRHFGIGSDGLILICKTVCQNIEVLEIKLIFSWKCIIPMVHRLKCAEME